MGSVGAFYSEPFCGRSASASASSWINGTPAATSVSASSSGYCGLTGILAGAGATMVVRLKATTPTAGSLVLSGNGSSAHIDVGRDGVIEILGQTIPIVVDSTGIEISMTCSASAVSPSRPSSSEWADITFQPQTAGMLTALTPCGPEMAAWMSQNGSVTRLDFLVHRTIVTPATFLVLGVAPVAVQVPPTNCVLGTNIQLDLP